VLTVSYNPVEETAHQVGRALHSINNPGLTEQIVAEVQAELAAVEQAELGELSGRARQAVALTRAGASPAQVQAADKILATDPLGSPALFTEIEGTAGAIAATHWLQAAADVTARVSGFAPTQIIMEADNIEALAHETPTIVLERLQLGLSPYETVTGLIRGAMTVAEGQILDLDELLDHIAQADEVAEQHQDPRLRDALLNELRTTPLDPKRPAHDLLEDLLDGIRGCWLIYQEDTDPEDEDAFADAVRAEANANRARLT
jgi:plasmid stabilization system protein ParE